MNVNDVELSPDQQAQACQRGQQQEAQIGGDIGERALASVLGHRQLLHRDAVETKRRDVSTCFRREAEAAHLEPVRRQRLRLATHPGVGGVVRVGDHTDEHLAISFHRASLNAVLPSNRNSSSPRP